MRHLLLSALIIYLSPPIVSAQVMVSEFELHQLKGWTLIDVSYVSGAFEGCDYGQRVPLDNDLTLRCNSYGYSYAYRPPAIIFAKGTVAGAPVHIKALINGHAYDMEPLKQ